MFYIPQVIKARWIGMFIFYSLLSGVSFFMNMTFYPKAIIITSLPLLYIRFLNTMTPVKITIGGLLLIVISTYFFWDNYVMINIIAYIVTMFLIVLLYVDYINVVGLHEALSSEPLTYEKLFYYINPRYIFLITLALISFIISIVLKLF